MKKILFVSAFTIGITVGIGLICKGVGNIQAENEPLAGHTEAAVAYQYKGMYVFMYSQPQMPYDSVGVLTTHDVYISGGADVIISSLVDGFVQKARATHPDADAIIFIGSKCVKVKIIEFR